MCAEIQCQGLGLTRIMDNFTVYSTMITFRTAVGKCREKRLATWIREHKDACRKGELEKSAIAEHAWNHHHSCGKRQTSD